MKIKILPLNGDLVIRSLDRSRLKLTETVRRNGQKNQKKEENTKVCVHRYQFIDTKVTQNENQFKIPAEAGCNQNNCSLFILLRF